MVNAKSNGSQATRNMATVIWPADFTHTHRGIVSKTQEKYIATGWYNLV